VPERGARDLAYFDRLERARPTRDASDAELALSLWRASERAVGIA
jgi:hypothetical protein